MQFFGGPETISPSMPGGGSNVVALGVNQVHMMYIFNRNGACLLYREWNSPLKTLTAPQDHKLMFGLLFSLKSFTSKMDSTSYLASSVFLPISIFFSLPITFSCLPAALSLGSALPRYLEKGSHRPINQFEGLGDLTVNGKPFFYGLRSYAPERILTTIRSLRSTVGWCGFVVSRWMEKGSECKISAANLRSDISIPFLPLARNPFSNSIFSDELEEEKQAESKRSSDVACRKKVQMNSTHFQMKLSTERGMIFRRTPFLTNTFSWLQEGSLNGVFNSGAASRIEVEQRCRSPEEGPDELNPFSDEAVDRRGYDFQTNPFSDEHIFGRTHFQTSTFSCHL
ncbi:hypothetical protein ACLOJK_020517 [Asimina triloba]